MEHDGGTGRSAGTRAKATGAALTAMAMALSAPLVLPSAAEAAPLSDKLVNSDFSYPAGILSAEQDYTYFDPATGRYKTHEKARGAEGTVPGYDAAKFAWSSTERVADGGYVDGNVELQRDERDGNVYCELVASQSGTAIYQDVSTVPNSRYTWTLRHASLNDKHVDKMSVKAGPPERPMALQATRTTVNGNGDVAGPVGTTIQTKVSNTRNRDHSAQWETYEGTYVVPEGQTVTRFTFESIEGAGGTLGNILDDITFQISYRLDADLGDAAVADDLSGYYPEGGIDLSTHVPARPGFTFLGWSAEKLDPVASAEAYEEAKPHLLNSATMTKSGLRLFAVWAINPQITFTDGMSEDAICQATCAFGGTVSAPEPPTRTGFTFAGWSRDLAGVCEDATIEAIWEPITYRVNFDANDGACDFPAEGTMDEATFTFDCEDALPACEMSCPTYDFAGWNTESDGTGDAYEDGARVSNLSEQDGDEVTLFAQWQERSFDVSFEDGFGEVLDVQSVREGAFPAAPEDPERDGYAFAGWDSPFEAVHANETFTATWKEAKKPVAFGIEPAKAPIAAVRDDGPTSPKTGITRTAGGWRYRGGTRLIELPWTLGHMPGAPRIVARETPYVPLR